MERMYEFRQQKYTDRLILRRDVSLQPTANEYTICDDAIISLSRNAPEVVRVAAKEFAAYLLDSMDVSARVWYSDTPCGHIAISIDDCYKGYKSYRIVTTESGIQITSHDGRGAQQALYYLESRIAARHAPYIERGVIERAPLFSPRMVHSGYAQTQFPDVHLREIAYAGMDAILLVCNGVESVCRITDDTTGWFYDCNELVYRASRYGIDVYIYSFIHSTYGPDDPQAEEYYESTYGIFFERCPGIKGVVLVGESIAFPSKDPNSNPTRWNTNYTDGIPNEKPSADVWPCMDYAPWLTLVKNVIRRHKADADVVFWTYNFGYAPLEHRRNLLETLPTDISLLVTFEMFKTFDENGIHRRLVDYTLSFEGPGDYFKSEAEIAKRRGIRLYAMCNTGGRTWDFGTLPYEPMPQQWMKRYAALKKAQEDWGLCGLMESHHMGFFPSFISQLARESFESPNDDKNALDWVLRANFGENNLEPVKVALNAWSRAITKYPCSCEDQYSSSRTGPTYPFNLVEPTVIPDSIVGFYSHFYSPDNNGGKSPTGVRIPVEIQMLQEMQKDIQEGLALLVEISNPNEELEKLINMGKFLLCCTTTGILTKRWFVVRHKLWIESDPAISATLCDEAEKILEEERKNVEAAIPLVQFDSRLGYEPAMEYICSEAQLRWKLRQLEFVRNCELRAFRGGLTNKDNYERVFMMYRVTRP